MPLSPLQDKTIYQSTARYNIWCGAISSGKTHASVMRLADFLRTGPAGDVMIIGVNRMTIQRNVINLLYGMLGWPPPSSKSTEAKIYGRHVYFVGANNEGSVKAIQGATLVLAYVDEVACIPQPFFRMLEGRLRVPGAMMIATCNPEGPNHWLKKNFIDRSHELDLKYWQFTMDDNPILEESYKKAMKATYTGHWYNRLILGEWAVASGLIYDSFDDMNIYEHPFDNPQFYVVGIDYGTSNATAAVLLAINPRKWPQIRVEKEYYYDSVKAGRAKVDSELAADLKEFIGWRSIRACYVDPSAASLKWELRANNIPVLDAKNDVLDGIKTVSKFISQKSIVIQKGCRMLLDCIQSYSWCPKAADRGIDKPLKEREHILDALRYGIYSVFPTGEIESMDENITIEQIRRQAYGGDENLLGFSAPQGGYY